MQQLKEFGGWQVGQQCQVKELNGVFEIGKIYDFGSWVEAFVYKLKKDGTRNGKNATPTIDKLLPLGAAQPTTDKNGLTAEQYAKQLFASGFAKHDWYNTTRESLVKVLSISKSGRVKIQWINIKKGVRPRVESVSPHGHKVYSQEDSAINFASLDYELRDGDIQTYTPKLYDGEWYFWHGNETIKAPTMRTTWLLD